ncbi:PAS domain-containing sensor histidine kinase [uncultured Winogradskyella sp.]|uniref:PAS domain-containing sensor histidine kinase n=1 Tax=uncultured Winogradskyella sp. TaxID=395353 RepID=UPI0026256628|nr:PAS domain-containing sensor histidine kinase [uncultured Winogradskyella sp.]|tara:strand:+ start:6026 stop:7201 length:1176 start_codon:yes stop_codon:yes gene_type:complete
MKLSDFNLTNYKSKFYEKNKLSNENLDDSKHKIALEISNVGLWDWDVTSNKVFYSKESKQIIGYDEDDLKNTSKFWDSKVHPDDKESYFSDFKSHLNGDVDIYENKYRILCKSGVYKWVLDKGKIIERDENGKPTRIIGTHTDITNLKNTEDKLNKNLQLITSQNKRLYNFTHIVSHNLKTHIGNFKNILEFYEEAKTEIEKEDLVLHLKSISDSLTSTIVDLDDIISIKSKAQVNQINERVYLHNCCNKIIESLSIDSQNKGVTIHNALRKDEVILSNKSYLDSIFYNIISNGIKYSDPNKKSQIIIQSVHTKSHIKILISDNGIGIDMDKFKGQIFEMYQTFHGTMRQDSRGVGLYITKTQVDALQGEIQIESKLDEGTAFSLTFPKQK